MEKLNLEVILVNYNMNSVYKLNLDIKRESKIKNMW